LTSNADFPVIPAFSLRRHYRYQVTPMHQVIRVSIAKVRGDAVKHNVPTADFFRENDYVFVADAWKL
jgi:hypothetical protein